MFEIGDFVKVKEIDSDYYSVCIIQNIELDGEEVAIKVLHQNKETDYYEKDDLELIKKHSEVSYDNYIQEIKECLNLVNTDELSVQQLFIWLNGDYFKPFKLVLEGKRR